MSVLASKRTLSRHEYVNTFLKLYQFTTKRMSKIAKRKYRWLGEPIVRIMNDTYKLIMQTNNDFFEYGIKMISDKERTELLINSLLSLQKPLLALWNIDNYKTRTMVCWIEFINKEIYYISLLGGYSKKEVESMFILDYETIKNVEFINTMSKLHKMIYSKTISLNESIRRTNGTLLMNLSDEAFYRVCHANLFIPKNKKMYVERQKDISIALECLRQMQQPMASLFLLMNYSENVMKEMAYLLNREMKLLKGVMKSDAIRFSSLT